MLRPAVGAHGRPMQGILITGGPSRLQPCIHLQCTPPELQTVSCSFKLKSSRKPAARRSPPPGAAPLRRLQTPAATVAPAGCAPWPRPSGRKFCAPPAQPVGWDSCKASRTTEQCWRVAVHASRKDHCNQLTGEPNLPGTA